MGVYSPGFPETNPLSGRVVASGKKGTRFYGAALWIHPASTDPIVVPVAGLPVGKLKSKFK